MAELMVDKAQTIARPLPDGTTRSALFRDTALTQAKIGKLMEALQSEREITDSSYAGFSLPYIADAQIDAGNLEEAMKTAELLTTIDPIRKSGYYRQDCYSIRSPGRFYDSAPTKSPFAISF